MLNYIVLGGATVKLLMVKDAGRCLSKNKSLKGR